MAAPPAYLDEDIPATVVQALRARGFTLLTTTEADALAEDDESQLIRSSGLGYVLVTHNRWHFRRLHEQFERAERIHGGIALLPQDTHVDRLILRLALMLDWIGEQDATQSKLWQWNDCQQALIRGLRPPGYSASDVMLAIGQASHG